MVEHREKRCPNASSRGIESDRSIIRFTRAYPVRVEGGTRPSARPSSARRPVQTATSQVLRKECLADPHGIRATGVERRLRPRTRASTAGNCPAVLFRAVSNGSVEPASSRSRRNASRRHVATNPSPPWPAGGSPTESWIVSDEEAGAERSEALSPAGSTSSPDESGGVRTRISYAGMLAHGVRDASTTGAIPRSKDLEGDQSPGRIGRRVAGNGGHWYVPICGATPRR